MPCDTVEFLNFSHSCVHLIAVQTKTLIV